jgi:hypothetical protein
MKILNLPLEYKENVIIFIIFYKIKSKTGNIQGKLNAYTLFLMKETSSLSEKVEIDVIYSKWCSLTYFEKLVLKEEAVEFNKDKDKDKDDRPAEESKETKEKRLKHNPDNKKKVNLNYSFYKKKYEKTTD